MILADTMTISGYGVGSILLFLTGLIICVAIVYAVMRICESPPWMYKIAAVVGLVVLLVVTILFFFGGETIRFQRYP